MVLGSLPWDGSSYSRIVCRVAGRSGCGTCVGLQWSIIVRSLGDYLCTRIELDWVSTVNVQTGLAEFVYNKVMGVCRCTGG